MGLKAMARGTGTATPLYRLGRNRSSGRKTKAVAIRDAPASVYGIYPVCRIEEIVIQCRCTPNIGAVA